jgi:S-adenosylmethionine:tRNA-ribosyltransferase-isomerase (queuine synthetase)
MAITVSSVKNKNQLTKHITSQSDFDILSITYGSKSELVSALSTQFQQPNKTMGLIVMSLKGTPNIDG